MDKEKGKVDYFEGVLDGHEVFWWPETQALLKRMGIDVSLKEPTKEIIIRIPVGEIPTVTHVMGMLDTTEKRK